MKDGGDGGLVANDADAPGAVGRHYQARRASLRQVTWAHCPSPAQRQRSRVLTVGNQSGIRIRNTTISRLFEFSFSFSLQRPYESLHLKIRFLTSFPEVANLRGQIVWEEW